MKDLDILVFVAVFQEMLGAMLWVGLAAVAAILLGFAWLLLRERGLRMARLAWAELAGLAGGVVAVLFMQWVTNSRFADIGGPVDWVLVAAIWLAGFVLATLAGYLVLGLLAPRGGVARSGEAAALPHERQRPA
jgi:hypothetical protein